MKKILLVILIILPTSIYAVSFDKNNIISDHDLTNYASMSLDRIENFLDDQGGVLADYFTTDKDGATKSAAEIIYNACQKYLLSPKFMLVTIQKESSLVTRSSASQHLLDYALGYGCPDGQGCGQDYAGFANQVYAAARTVRDGYLADLEDHNSTIAGWGVNVSKEALDGWVTPENMATAVLYTYTPWIGYYGGNANSGGNSLFWDIWQRWFPSSDYIIKYPDGSLLQSKETGVIYVIKNSKKRAFTSLGALVANYDLNRVISVGEDVLDQYKDGIKIYFPNYTLLQNPNGGIYLYIDGKKRGIPSQEIFRQLGYNPEETVPATWAELSRIPDGALITETDVYPGGILYQDETTGAIFYIDENKIRHAIYSKEILTSNYQDIAIISKSPTEINNYELGNPVKFKDGDLVTSPKNNAIYIIDNGKKRPFKSGKVFKKLGYKFENVIITKKKILNLHKDGKMVTLNKKNK
jgi:hypothetical protein